MNWMRLDTGADGTLIPLEVVSVLQLPLLDGRVPVAGVGGGDRKSVV